MKDKLTAEEIAKKHYPDHKFEECEMSCMQCDNGVCESKDFSRKELTEDIQKLAESELEAVKAERDEFKALLESFAYRLAPDGEFILKLQKWAKKLLTPKE